MLELLADERYENEHYHADLTLLQGQLSYKVKWVGYDETTMEPEDNL